MTACRNLPRLGNCLDRNIARLADLPRTAARGHARQRSQLLATVCIEALNSWANFARAYYLSCLLGPKAQRGHRVKAGAAFTDFNAAIGLAVLRFKPSAAPKADGTWHRRDEPTWHDPAVLRSLLTVIAASNRMDVDAALSVGTRVFLDLPTVRNYYAHRNHRSETAAQSVAANYTIPLTLTVDDILLTPAVGRPGPLIDDWLADLRTVAALLCW